ncbi:MAG TPA: hypothetical protein VN673_18105, partial [Clostridia bacterium]|nr:hypothetical protein [Clostridia bacterium]
TGGRFNMSRENWKVYRVENAGSNQVQIVVSAAFPSLKDMMGLGAYTWGPSLVMMDDSTAQIDTNNQLRITFTREAGRSQSYLAAQTERYLKRIRMRQEWKLVLPGKIASSDFPLTDSNSTSLVFDPNSSELVDGVSKLMKLPALTVVADPAGVKFDGVLKSSELAEQMRSSMETEATIPITDAGPGFVAEPQAIEITTFHEFPDVRQLKESRRGTMILPPAENEGTAIQVKLFPPKGRILKSAGSVKVKLAKDDQGRPIPTLSKARRSSYSINSTGDGEKAVTVRLEMGLPEPDAKAIDEVQAEAVVLTIGGYKEMVFTNAQAEVKKEIDLGTIVSGAKLVIQKATSKGPAESLQIIVTGPKEVRQLEFTTGSEGSGTSQASVYDRNVTEKEGIVTRTVQVQNYNFGMNARTKENPIQLIARMPQDYKNERLQFTLTALDLL